MFVLQMNFIMKQTNSYNYIQYGIVKKRSNVWTVQASEKIHCKIDLTSTV